MSGDHSQDRATGTHQNLTLAEGRGPTLTKPDHAIREETIGKEGIKEARETKHATEAMHREVGGGPGGAPDTPRQGPGGARGRQGRLHPKWGPAVPRRGA
jgi:hypothetical protein